jgi:hypothetical protein
MTVACLESILPQLGQQCGGEILTPVVVIHGNAFYDILLTGGGGNQPVTLPYEGGAVKGKIRVQTGVFQKCPPGLQPGTG